MKELTVNEARMASGGYGEADAAGIGAALGGLTGLVVAAQSGMTAAEAATLAGIVAAGFSGIAVVGAAAGSVGWDIGTFVYEIPAVNEFIANTIDSIFMPEPVGTVTVGPLTPSDTNSGSGGTSDYNTPFQNVSDLPPGWTWTEWERMLVQGIL